ncbi:MAG: hypothetical protein AB7O97_07270 [Planctomycetota bacterium]
MGHIAFGAPGLDRFHLVERLARELVTRGHRVTVLCVDPGDFAFWSAQGLAATWIAPGAPIADRTPWAEFAELDCRRAGHAPSPGRVRAATLRLRRLLPNLLRCFETDPPDLLLLHQRRTGAHALLQFVARECGTRTLWTGCGLLPHTMQLDDEGLDGDARVGRRSAWDFRGLDADPEFLTAALAGVVGRNVPPALSRRAVRMPPWWARLRAALVGRGEGSGRSVLDAFTACWQAVPPQPAPPRTVELPPGPFVAVLLQTDDDDRLRLDAVAPPTPATLVAAARDAAHALDRTMRVVAVLPPRGLLARDLAPLRRLAGVTLELDEAAIEACVAATAVVTVNAPQATVALLADTPVVHLGRAPYGMPGVATRATVDTLAAALPQALGDDQPELRRRFLGWLLSHGHVWCSAEQPDHNGLCGLILQIERRLPRAVPVGGQLHYRAGPAWPLTAEGRT